MTDLSRLVYLESKRFSFDEIDKKEYQSLYDKIQSNENKLVRIKMLRYPTHALFHEKYIKDVKNILETKQ